MASVYSQVTKLEADLAYFKPDATVEWSIGKIANALIIKAKEEQPNDIALAVIDPFEEAELAYGAGSIIRGQHAGAVRAILGQVATATKPRPRIG